MLMTTLLPHPALREYVQRYIELTIDSPTPFQQCAGPAGGPVLIVLLEGEERAGVKGGDLTLVPRAYLLGQTDRANIVAITGRTTAFMIQFAAVGAYALLGLSVRELTNQAADIGAVTPLEIRAWSERLADEPDMLARAAITDQILLRRLLVFPPAKRSDRLLSRAALAVQIINQSQGLIRVEALAARLNVTSRTLLRQFEEAVGLTVQAYIRIVRFQATSNYLNTHTKAPWSEIVYRFSYADQSHLIRDFQRYYGEPPSVFRARQEEIRLAQLLNFYEKEEILSSEFHKKMSDLSNPEEWMVSNLS